MKKSGLFEARHYATYFVANAINNILYSPMGWLRNLDEFYGDLRFTQFVEPFPTYSAFHKFIEFIVDSIVFEELEKIDFDEIHREISRFTGMPSVVADYERLPLNHALLHYEIPHILFKPWLADQGTAFDDADLEDARGYYAYLVEEGVYEQFLEKVVDEVFFITFLNRNMLMQFHELLAEAISMCPWDAEPDYKHWFAREGILRRQPIPEWAKNAVYFRDRGRCVLCNTDLSGLVTLQNEDNFDHLVPLARGGLNDVTNLQLLCAACNRRKSGGSPKTSLLYERWY